jgi:hypothetical protein
MPTARELLEQADALMRRNRKRGKGRGDVPTLSAALDADGTLAPTVILAEAVAASPIALECTVEDVIRLPSSETTANAMVLGRVVEVHVADDAVVDGMIDHNRVKALGRLGYHDYCVVDDVFSMVRPA